MALSLPSWADIGSVVAEDAASSAGLSETALSCLQVAYPERREDFAQLLNCLGLVDQAVEVGVQMGVHAEIFLRSWRGARLVLVDRWQGVDEPAYVDIANRDTSQMALVRQRCEERMAPFQDRVAIRSMWSVDAAATVADDSLDFVYLDARHDFLGVLSDITAWWPKLRSGGIFAGHDHCDGEMPEGDFFVRSALLAFFGSDLQVMETREWDRYRSFFVFKTPEIEARAHATASRQVVAPVGAHKKYLPLYQGAVAAARGDRNETNARFLRSCHERCFDDCDHRLQVVYALGQGNTSSQWAADASQMCVGLADGSRLGSTNSARGPPSPAQPAEQQGAPPRTTEAEEEAAAKRYLEVCHARCEVTCEQRCHLFETMGGTTAGAAASSATTATPAAAANPAAAAPDGDDGQCPRHCAGEAACSGASRQEPPSVTGE